MLGIARPSCRSETRERCLVGVSYSMTIAPRCDAGFLLFDLTRVLAELTSYTGQYIYLFLGEIERRLATVFLFFWHPIICGDYLIQHAACLSDGRPRRLRPVRRRIIAASRQI